MSRRAQIVLGIAIALVGLGLGLLGAGWIVEIPPDLWDAGSFRVNIASAFVAACFGVPFAYFFIGYLLRKSDSDRRRSHLLDRITQLLRETQDGANDILGPQATNEELQEIVTRAKNAAFFFAGLEKALSRRVGVPQKQITQVAAQLTTIRTKVDSFTIFDFPAGNDADWSRLQFKWELLQQLLKEQEIGDVEIVTPHLVRDIAVFLQTPHQEFFKVFYATQDGTFVASVHDALLTFVESNELSDSMNELSYLDEEEVSVDINAIKSARSVLKELSGRLAALIQLRVLLELAQEQVPAVESPRSQ